MIRGAFRLPCRGPAPLVVLAFAVLAPSPARAQDAPLVSEIVVEGARTIDQDRVRALSGLAPGQRLHERSVQRAIRALWETNLFDDVALTTRPAAETASVVVVLEVVEAPVITGVQFSGLDKVKTRDVEAALGIKRGDRLLDHRLHQAEIDVEEIYRGKGFYLAEVEIVTLRPGVDSTSVEVRVREGRKVAIESIRFQGNRSFSDGRLRKSLKTKPEGFWFWQDGEFMESSWREDLSRNLPAFYHEHGYLDMRVVGDSMGVDRSRGKMHLVVTVEEGSQYHVGEVAIEGNTRFSRVDLQRFMRLSPGDVVDMKAIEKTREDFLNLYADDGYIYAQIQPVRRTRPDTTIVDLTWAIREGTPAEIRHVAIRGNTVTHESVIRRQLFVAPGERFRRADVRNSLLSLEGLGFFEPGISPTTRVADEQTGDIDLTFEVREKRTGALTLGAAVGGGTGLSGFVGYEQPNLFGQGKQGRVRWEFGSRNKNLELGYTEPVFLGSKTSMTLSFFDIDRRYINTSFRQEVLGGSVRFGTPLPWDNAVRVYYGYKWQRIDLESTDQDDTRFGGEYPRTESGVTLGLVRDTRLPRLHPIQGARHSLTTDMSGGLLGGTVGFQKVEFETSWFAPTFNDRTVLNLVFKTGGIHESRFVPLTEQFVLGGVQYPSQGLRGYAENCVTVTASGLRAGGVRCDDRGNAFVLMTAEHFIKITNTIYTSVFFDAGDVFREFRDVTFADLKRGAGVGLQIDLPGLGPLGLDYGYGFDRFDAEGNRRAGWQLHFRFGQLLR